MTTARNLRIGLGALGVATLGYGVYGLFNESGIRDQAAVGEWLVGGVIGHDFLLAPVVFVLGAVAHRFTDARWRGRLAAVLLIGGSLTLISIPALLRQGLNRNKTVLPLDYARNLGVLLAVLVAAVAAYGCGVALWRSLVALYCSLRPVVVEDADEEEVGEVAVDEEDVGEVEVGEEIVDEVVADEEVADEEEAEEEEAQDT